MQFDHGVNEVIYKRKNLVFHCVVHKITPVINLFRVSCIMQFLFLKGVNHLTTTILFAIIKFAVIAGRGAVWKRTWFGTKGPEVQILSPRPAIIMEARRQKDYFLVDR